MAQPGLTVTCVLWMGDFRGRRYSPEWVRRLRNMVARNLSRPHRFVCLSNVDVEGVETIPLPEGFTGWWNKLALFRPGLFDGRVLYLDLDSIIVDSLDEMVALDGEYLPAPHSSYWVGEGMDHRPGVVRHTCSCCLLWTAGAATEIWTEFTPAAMKTFRGDQDWMGHVMGHAPTLPAAWFRKLKTCRDGPPPGVKIVASMPDKNDVAVEKHEWVREIWQ